MDVTGAALDSLDSEELWRFLEPALVPYVLWAERGRILRWNRSAAALYGYSAGEALGQDLHALLRTPEPDAVVREALASRGSWSGELEVRTRSDRAVRVRCLRLLGRGEGRPVVIESHRELGVDSSAELPGHDSERKLAQILEAGQLGSWDWNVQTGEVRFGGRWAVMLGYEPDEIEPHVRSWESLIHPDEASHVAEVISAHLEGRTEYYECEHRLRHKDGSWRWILDRGRVVEWDAEGKPLRAIGTHADVTERRHAEERRRLSEERLRLATEVAGIFSWELELSTWRLDWGANAARVIGAEPASLSSDLEEALFFVVPEDRPRVLEEFRRAVCEPGRRVVLDFRGLDGRFWRSQGLVLADGSGSPSKVIGVTQDVTETRRTEAEIRYQLALTETITNNTRSALFMTDSEGRCTFANPASLRITGYRTEELLGEILHDKIHHLREDGTPLRIDECPLDRALPLQEALVDYEDVFVHRQGHFYPVRCNARPILTNGTPMGTVIEVLDVTEEKRLDAERLRILEREKEARRAAEEASRAKDEFLAVLSHELRTPLHAIKGWVNMLQEGMLDPDARARAIAVIARSVDLQNALIDDLLDVSRIISGKLSLDMARVPLRSLVEQAIEESRPSADLKGLLLISDLDEVGEVRGDRARLRQVIANLLGNAMKFTPSGGSVAVRLERRGDRSWLTVTDTGVGIAPTLLPRIFDRFQQANSSSRRGHGGLGLGLAITRHLVQLHGGSISAASLGQGKGAQFRVELPSMPSADEDEDEDTASKGAARSAGALAGVRLLVVDDDDDALEMLRLALESQGARVETASDARGALDQLERHRIDVLVSDLGMPELDGYDLIQAIRARGLGPDRLPAIALSGYASTEDRARAIASGFQRHLAKPVNLKTLGEEITALVTR